MLGLGDVNGLPVEMLEAPDAGGGRGVTRAYVAPGRGMMLLQAQGRTEASGEFDLLHAPPLAEAVTRLNGAGSDDFAGNLSFSFGGAILLPYANRIRGRSIEPNAIEAEIDGGRARLPRNWGGKKLGAVRYAMHGLILRRASDRLSRPAPNRLRAWYDLDDFAVGWPSRTSAEIEWALEGGQLILRIGITNNGDLPLPMGVGWHPYFKLGSGRRHDARLRLQAARHLEVNDYDEVLPTGRAIPTQYSAYDFSDPHGAPLADRYLDDCFVNLETSNGAACAEIIDVSAGYGLRVTSLAPPVSAFQVYAPPGEAFVVLEPQTNWPDPFSEIWATEGPVISRIEPGQALTYRTEVELFTPETRG